MVRRPSGPYGPPVHKLSGQVSGPVRQRSPDKKSGPLATPPTKSGVAWPRPFRFIDPKTDIKNRSQMDEHRTCSEPGCDRSHYGHGLCHGHWDRRRNGSQLTGPIAGLEPFTLETTP